MKDILWAILVYLKLFIANNFSFTSLFEVKTKIYHKAQQISFNWSHKYDRMQSAAFSPVLTKVLLSPRHPNTLPKVINSGLWSFLPQHPVGLCRLHEKIRGRAVGCGPWRQAPSSSSFLSSGSFYARWPWAAPLSLKTAGTQGFQMLLPPLDIGTAEVMTESPPKKEKAARNLAGL